jgi:ABC-type lipoprotein export system ATPase subunit
VLVVTHDTRLLEFADRILYIEDGVLTHEERPTANVYRIRA